MLQIQLSWLVNFHANSFFKTRVSAWVTNEMAKNEQVLNDLQSD